MSNLIYYQEPFATIYRADAFSLLPVLPRESVHCVTTSPPYWGLRKYEGQQERIWGGDRNCVHEWGHEIQGREYGRHDTSDPTSTDFGGWANWDGDIGNSAGQFCSLCNAWKGAFGLEPTPEMYVQHTVEALRAIRQVLRRDGVVWWNIGDSYAMTSFRGGDTAVSKGNVGRKEWKNFDDRSTAVSGLKPEDLCLIPLHIAIAAQEDGWYVRSIIIWNKPNPMPESVNGWRWEGHKIRVDENGNIIRKGGKLVECPGCEVCLPNDGLVLRKGSWRPTNTYEVILMLTKSDDYYCDADAVREPYTELLDRWGGDKLKADGVSAWDKATGQATYRDRDMRPNKAGRNLRDVWEFPTAPFGMEMCKACGHIYDSGQYQKLPTTGKSHSVYGYWAQDGREMETPLARKVCRCGASDWLSHFATFPGNLPSTCIKASTSEKGCCPKCGAPWARVSDTVSVPTRTKQGDYYKTRDPERHINQTEILGWRPTCNCELEPVPCLVLDPFMGTGRTLQVAKKLGRKSIGIDVSESYCKLAQRQISEVNLPLLLV